MDAGSTSVPSEVATSKASRPRRSPYRRAPGRSQVGVALRRTREDLVGHLGGEPTDTEAILVEEAAKARVIAAVVGDYILRQETLVRDGELLPVVLQHAALVSGLAKLLKPLGL